MRKRKKRSWRESAVLLTNKYGWRSDWCFGSTWEILKGHAAWLKANPQSRVEVEGHCDERGTSEYNLALGAKRAESAKRYLIDLGISPSTLSTISYGESFLSAGSRMRPAGQRIGARTLS
jgi:peptidoglycan-associated lipoprotein